MQFGAPVKTYNMRSKRVSAAAAQKSNSQQQSFSDKISETRMDDSKVKLDMKYCLDFNEL